MEEDKIKQILLENSVKLNGRDFSVTNGGSFYSIWEKGIRYGEARIEGKNLVLYKDRYGNDHEITQWLVETIPL